MVLSLLTACSGDGEGTGTVWQKLRAATDPIAAPANAVWQPLVNMNLSVASAANLPDGTVLMWAADSQTGFGGGTDAYYTVYDPLACLQIGRPMVWGPTCFALAPPICPMAV